MYLPGVLPSGNAPPSGTFTAQTGGFFNGEPNQGTGAAEATDGGAGDDPVDAILTNVLGYPLPGSDLAPIAKPGYGDWLPGSPAVLEALSRAGIDIRERITLDNSVADRGVCPPGEEPTNPPAKSAAPTDGPKWLLGASVMLLLAGMSKGARF